MYQEIETPVLDIPKLELAGLSRFLGCTSVSYTSAHSTNIVVPDSGTCARRWQTPAIFHVRFLFFPPQGMREESRLLRRASTLLSRKKLLRQRSKILQKVVVLGSSLKRFLRYEGHRSTVRYSIGA